MDKDRFRNLLEDPKRDQKELMTMRENAIAKNEIAYIHLSETVLDARFPNWQPVKSRRGGSQPRDVMFLGKERYCESEKEAYIWLMERFTQHYRRLFTEVDWDTVYVAIGKHKSVYFAKSKEKLFSASSEHAEDPNKYHRLANGWYAKVMLSEPQKIELLEKFAFIAKLKIGVDWDWNSRGRNAILEAASKPSLDDLLNELRGKD